jgi:hypothetical protein
MKSHWMTHNGKNIFFADYSHMTIDDLKAEIAQVEPLLCSQPKNSVLCLADVTGSYASPDAVKITKELTAKTNYHVHKRAVIGVVGVQKALLKAITQFSEHETASFGSIESALEWLVQD